MAAVVTFFAVRLSGRPPDKRHTYGYGKVENLSALFEIFLLLATCVWIIYKAIQRLFFKEVQVQASIWAFIFMAISIVIDFTRSRILYRAARKYGSQALEADALHFSTDIWSSSVVIAGLALVSLSKWLDMPWLAKADAVAAMGGRCYSGRASAQRARILCGCIRFGHPGDSYFVYELAHEIARCNSAPG